MGRSAAPFCPEHMLSGSSSQFGTHVARPLRWATVRSPTHEHNKQDFRPSAGPPGLQSNEQRALREGEPRARPWSTGIVSSFNDDGRARGSSSRWARRFMILADMRKDGSPACRSRVWDFAQWPISTAVKHRRFWLELPKSMCSRRIGAGMGQQKLAPRGGDVTK